MAQPNISLCLHTASPDNFLQSQNIPSAIAMVIDCLNHQEFDGTVELVICDAHYETNMERVAAIPSRFPVIHVPPHPAHRYWADMGHIDIASMKNSALIHANGELVISIDDAEVFPPHFVAAYWKYWKEEQRFLMAFHRRYSKINVENGLPTYPLEGEYTVSDSRDKFFEEEGVNVIRREDGGWCYAGTSCSLEMAIALNGHDELCDGQKSGEDCQWGISMEMAGAKFVIDRNVWVGILEHAPVYTEGVKKRTNFTAIENHGLISCARQIEGFNVANRPGRITDRALAIIQADTIKYRNPPFDPLATERAADLAKWLATPTFDIIEQRRAIRPNETPKEKEIPMQVVEPPVQTGVGQVMQQAREIIAQWSDAKLGDWWSKDQARSIVDLILSHKPKNVVQIGVFAGNSLTLVGMAVKAVGEGTVTGIDPYSRQYGIEGMKNPDNIKFWGGMDYDGKKEEAKQRIGEFELGNVVTIVEQSCEEAVTDFDDGSIDLLNMNGNPARALPVAKLYLPKIANGGYIYLCDTGWSEGGSLTVKPASAWLIANGCTVVESVGSVSVYRKGGKPTPVFGEPFEAKPVSQVRKPVVAAKSKLTINTYYDKVFCINLASRTDRMEQFRNMCQEHGIEFERFDAYQPTVNGKVNGVLGCAESHRAIYNMIAHNGWRRTLILEDDAKPVVDVQGEFDRLIRLVPDDADVVYLGALYDEKPLERINANCIRVGKMSGTHAYGITCEFARKVAPLVCTPVDAYLSGHGKNNRFYAISPRIFVQRAGFSDIQGQVTDYEHYGVDGKHEAMV